MGEAVGYVQRRGFIVSWPTRARTASRLRGSVSTSGTVLPGELPCPVGPQGVARKGFTACIPSGNARRSAQAPRQPSLFSIIHRGATALCLS